MNKVMYFSSHNCAVCQVLKPKVSSLIKNRFPKLQWEEVMIDDKPTIAANNQVFTVPVVVVFFEGKESCRFVRGFSISEIEKGIERPYHLLFESI